MTYAPHRSAPGRVATPDERRVERALRLRMRLWIAGGVVAALALIGFGVWAVATKPVVPGGALPRGGAAGVPVDGPFELAATGLRCGVSQVGPSELEQRAEGEYCLVGIRVRNLGDSPELFDGGVQRAFDVNGVAYAVAEQAAVFLNDGSPSLLEEIKPGATVTGVLPFDVPAGTKLRAAQLRGGLSTPGVRIALPEARRG